jgi:ribosomal protein L19E
MTKDSHQLEQLLRHVDPSRRELLKRLLVGGTVLTLVPTSSVLAQEGEGHGKGKGKGRKGKGKGKGKGRGKGKRRGGDPEADPN